MTIFGLILLALIGTLVVRGRKGVIFRKNVFSKMWCLPIVQFVLAVGLGMNDLEYSWLYDQLIASFCMSLFFLTPASIAYNIYLQKIMRIPQQPVMPYDEGSSTLPSNVVARRAIVEKINKKYDLNLASYQVDLIVNCSFQMPEWYNELEDMNRDYDSIYQWFSGETDWLRAYLRAFAVQNIVPDMNLQRQICLNAFETVFNSIDMSRYVSLHDCVVDINNKNYTNFDDITFMVAYRMLEENGKKYPLPTGYIPVVTNEIDELMKQYDSDPNGGRRQIH